MVVMSDSCLFESARLQRASAWALSRPSRKTASAALTFRETSRIRHQQQTGLHLLSCQQKQAAREQVSFLGVCGHGLRAFDRCVPISRRLTDSRYSFHTSTFLAA